MHFKSFMSFIDFNSFMSIHFFSCQFIYVNSFISISLFHFFQFNLFIHVLYLKSFVSIHSCLFLFQYIPFKSFQFIRLILPCQFSPFNTFISIHSFQFLHFNSFMSSFSFQFIPFNSFISSFSFQLSHVNSFISCISFHFNSLLSNPPRIPLRHVTFSKLPPWRVPGATW